MRGDFLLMAASTGRSKTAKVNPVDGAPVFSLAPASISSASWRAREIDIHIGQQFGVEQRAVQRAAGVVHPQPVAQGIERIALAGYISLAMTSVSVTLVTNCLNPGRPISSSSLFRKPTSNWAL